MPAPLMLNKADQEPVDAIPALNRWVRGVLLVVVAMLVAVFGVAIWLKPYDGEGQPLRMESHKQLGLPPCTFYAVTGGVPCPSCGMTTSFALLMHGDLGNSLRANAVGTILAVFCLLLIPWCLVCGIKGRSYFVLFLEQALTKVVVVFIALMLLRWAIVLTTMWLNR